MKFENKWYRLDQIKRIKISKRKKYKDNRDWKRYNNKLVKEVELILDFPMNRRIKHGVGRPFEYSNGLMLAISALKTYFNLPFRQTEGLVRFMKKQLKLKKVPDYSTINRRFSKVDVPIRANSKEPVVIAVDATGVKVTNRGEWMREQYKKWKRRGYLKLHIAVDVKSRKVLSVKVTDERKHDSTQLMPLLEGIDLLKKVIADGAYDSRDIFNNLSKRGINPVIRIRENSIEKSRGSFARKKVVKAYKKDPEEWKRANNYGQRWQVEAVFSSIKRRFGEFIRCIKPPNMVNELLMKCFVYNLVI